MRAYMFRYANARREKLQITYFSVRDLKAKGNARMSRQEKEVNSDSVRKCQT